MLLVWAYCLRLYLWNATPQLQQGSTLTMKSCLHSSQVPMDHPWIKGFHIGWAASDFLTHFDAQASKST